MSRLSIFLDKLLFFAYINFCSNMIIVVWMQVCILLCICFISTHQIRAITVGVGSYLCGQPTCLESCDAVVADTIGDLCLKSIKYSTNQRCIGSGVGGQHTMQMATPQYCFENYTYACYLESNAVMVSDTVALLCLNGTHLIRASTVLRGIGSYLCGQLTCFESYDAVAADTIGDLYEYCALLIVISLIAISIASTVFLLTSCLNSRIDRKSRSRRRKDLGSHIWSRRRVFWRNAGVSRESYIALALYSMKKVHSSRSKNTWTVLANECYGVIIIV